jgi:hypothetical protein
MISFAVIAAVAALPGEYVIDCSGFRPAGAEAAFTYRYECRDGKVLTSIVACDARVSPAQVAVTLTGPLEFSKWQVEMVPGKEAVFVVRGSKTSPIKSVTFTGDGWVPAVTRRIIVPPPAGGK